MDNVASEMLVKVQELTWHSAQVTMLDEAGHFWALTSGDGRASKLEASSAAGAEVYKITFVFASQNGLAARRSLKPTALLALVKMTGSTMARTRSPRLPSSSSKLQRKELQLRVQVPRVLCR